MSSKEKKGLNISVRSFLTALAVLFALMVFTYILTFIVPGGEFARTVDALGNTAADTQGGFRYIQGGLPFWKWLLSPVMVLGAEGSGTIIAIIAFLLVMGGVFNCLERSGLMKYMLDRLVTRFGHARYKLLAVVTLFFMLMGSVIGSFEECVPLAPIVVGLSVGLGWDALTGIGMCILAAGSGFAAGVCNPFTIGVAQTLAGLPMFSGIWLRIVSFALIYALLTAFLLRHAKKIDSSGGALQKPEAEKDPRMGRALTCFAVILGIGVAAVLSSSFLTFLQDYTMVIIAVIFLFSGMTALITAGMDGKWLGKTFLDGLVSILPAVVMILMATSIKYTLDQAHILDTILYGAVSVCSALPKAAVVLFIYLLVLIMNFFIPSGSAKAVLLIPIIAPLAQALDVPVQLCILAYAFGDGFSNAFYPTNSVLLISLGLTDVSYGDWAEWSGKFQLMNLLLTGLILVFGLAVGYC